MSVINTMLLELDKRRGRPGGEAIAGDAIRSIRPASRWQVPRNILLATAGLAAVSTAGAWWMQHRGADAASQVVIPAAKPPMASALPLRAVPNSASPAPVPIAAAATASAPLVAAIEAVPPSRENAVPGSTAAAADPPAPRAVAMAHLAAQPVPRPPITSAESEVTTPSTKSVAMTARAATEKTYSAAQLSAKLVSEAITLEQQGRQEDAKEPLLRVLAAQPLDIEARKMLIRLQMGTGRIEEARALLAEGQRLHPDRSDFTLALARLKAESGDATGAIQTLETAGASAGDDPHHHALLATLLLRVQRHDEAVVHYLTALRADPANPRWLTGLGVALENAGRQTDAVEAYQRAEGVRDLAPEIQTFLSERLARLGAQATRTP